MRRRPKRLGKPRATVDRQLKALHILGVLTLVEVELVKGIAWQYSLADRIDPSALVVPPKALPEKSPHTPSPHETSERSAGEDREGEDTSGVCTDFSGNGSTSTGPPPPPPDGTPSTNGRTAYVQGVLQDLSRRAVPSRWHPCEDCFQSDRDVLNLLYEHLGATPVDPEGRTRERST